MVSLLLKYDSSIKVNYLLACFKYIWQRLNIDQYTINNNA